MCGCASDRVERTGTTHEAVINGSPDTTHGSVVSIATSLDASSVPELCTGTIIAPRVVLTAGHCTLGQYPSALIVGLGPNALYPTSTLAVAAVVTYPGFSGSEGDIEAGLDLGVLVLAEDAAVASVPPNPIFSMPVDGTITIDPFSRIASYSMFMPRSCSAPGLSL